MRYLKKLTRRLVTATTSLVLLMAQITPFLLLSTQKVAALDTGFLTPTAIHTPNDWDTNTVANVQTSDNILYVSDNDGQEQGFSNFNLPAIVAGSTINGIEIQAEAKSTDNNGCRLGVLLSWNNGNNYTGNQEANLGSSDTVHTLGGNSDTWGRAWAVNDFTNSNFVVKIQDNDPGNQCDGNAVTSVDQLRVKIHYTVPAPQPDLTVVKSNNVGGAILFGGTFNWTLTVTNSGAGSASFDNEDILQDNLPTNASYSSASVLTSGGVTGSIDCNITSNNLDCDDNNNGSIVVIPAGNWFSVSFTVTPDELGTLTNPRSGGGNICRVDPDGVESESNEGNNDCVANSVTVSDVQPVPNPVLTQACGLDIALVIDNSTSISDEAMDDMKGAMTSFTNAFSGTPTEFSVTKFATSATVVQAFTNDLGDVNSAINAIPTNGGYTNWEDGFIKAASTLPNRTNPNLVVFVSDGDPTDSNNLPVDTNQPNAHLSPAITQANAIKSAGTRILAIGIGSPSLARLQAISSADAVITTDFAQLAADLAEFAEETCGGTITTQKLIDADGDLNTTDDQTPATGWAFDVDGTQTNPSATLTDVNGLTPAVEVDPGIYSITESAQEGYSVLDAKCEVDNQSVGSWQPGANSVTGMQVGVNDIVSCVFINHYNQGTLIVKKVVINDNGSQAASPSNFSFSVNGGTSVVFEGDGQNDMTVTSGLYTVIESPAPGYATTYSNCTNVVVPAGGSGTCTITNNDIPPKLTVTKVVNNSAYNGSLQVNDFPLYVGQVGVVSGVQQTFNVGQYTVSETGDDGYVASFTGDCDSDGVVGLLQIGEEYSCTITNTAKPGKLIVNKVVVNYDGGYAEADDFSFGIEGVENANFAFSNSLFDTDLGSKELDDLSAGTYTIVEDEYEGYEMTSNTCVDVAVSNGQTAECTITNDDIAPTLTLKKIVVTDDGGEAMADDWTLTAQEYENEAVIDENGALVDGSGGAEAVTQTVEVEAGVFYELSENGPEGYEASDWDCVGGNQDGNGVVLELGDEVVCTITNDDIAPVVSVVKCTNVSFTQEPTLVSRRKGCYSSVNSYGEFSFEYENTTLDDENSLVGEFTLDTDPATEDVNSSEELMDLKAGTLVINELPTSGWALDQVQCYGLESFETTDTGIYTELVSGDEAICYFYNKEVSELNLEKANNKPQPVVPGEEVTYTLTVTVPETSGSVYGINYCDEEIGIFDSVSYEVIQIDTSDECHEPVTVTDLPPENIDYVPGSWTAKSNVRGDLKASGVTTEPTYASPGDWALTSSNSPVLVPGEIVTLTYRAKVGNNASNGVHPDTAFARGYNAVGDEEILANESTGIFRGTDVEIVSASTAQRFVLGASTLVVTGQNNLLQILIGLTLVVGTLYLARKTRGSKSAPMLVAVGLVGATMWMFTASASASSTLSVQTPETPTKSAAFTLAYQVLTTDSSADFESELFVNGVSVATDMITSEFGDSKAFNVTLPSDGTYDLKIEINETSGPDYFAAETKTVVLDRSAPSSPVFGGTTSAGTQYTVKFTVPSGSDAQTVDVYASTGASFSLTDATKRGTVTATPGTEQSFTFTAPTSDKYYVAVVARDTNGNASQATGDSGVTVVPVASTSTGNGTTSGNQNGQVEGETTGDGETPAEGQGEVAGEETTAEQESTSDNKTGWWIFAGVLALIVGYYIYKTQMQSIDDDSKRNKKTK